MTPTGTLDDYLDVITGRGQGQGWIELRYRHPGGMRTRVYPACRRHGPLELRTAYLGQRRDVLIGCALRSVRHGKRARRRGLDAVGRMRPP